MSRRNPWAGRALEHAAREYLQELLQEEVRTIHLPISPEFEQAMISMIAQGNIPRTAGLQPRYRHPQQLVERLLAHKYISREAIRWVSLDANHFWRSPITEQIIEHPATTILEAVIAQRGGMPTYTGFHETTKRRWAGEEGWEQILDLWRPGGTRGLQGFYRFGDEVRAAPERVREVFNRLAVDADPEDRRRGNRRRAWDLYRIAQHI